MSLESALKVFDKWVRQFSEEEQEAIEEEFQFGLDKASELYVQNFVVAYGRRKRQEQKKAAKADIKLVNSDYKPKDSNIIIAKG